MNIFLETRIRHFFLDQSSFDMRLLQAYLSRSEIEDVYEREAEKLNLAVWEVKLITTAGSYSAAAASLTAAHSELAEMAEMSWSDYSLIAFK